MSDIEYRGVFEDEVNAYDVYFASVCSMQSHPGSGTRGHTKMSVQECSQFAIDMLIERRKAFYSDSTKSGGE